MLFFWTGLVLGCLIASGTGVCLIRFWSSRKITAVQDNKAAELAELSQLTGGLAHEIKNPLSIIKVNLKLISENLQDSGGAAQQTVRKIAVVRKEVERLEHIFEDFLRYIGRTELQTISVDINQLVNDIVDFFSPQAHSHSITIRLGLCNESLICKADEGMLKQVLLNLFINAQQAMADGGELILRTQRRGESAAIIISDTGTGIEPKKLDKIFDAYYSTKPGGGGLGLPTSKKIINAHHGTIKVDSDSGKGTSFTVELPLAEENNG